MSLPFLDIINNKPFVGRHNNNTDALAFIREQNWDTNFDGTGLPQEGMYYYNILAKGYRYWDGSQWRDFGGGIPTVPFHNNLPGLNVGDYQHLTQSQKIALTGGGSADGFHTHSFSGTVQSGEQALGAVSDVITVNLPVSYLTTFYAVVVQIVNLVNPLDPMLITKIIEKKVDSFKIQLSAVPPNTNYCVSWFAKD